MRVFNLLKIFILLTFFAASAASAKNINLYDQPNKNAKVTGTIDTDTGIIPIFTPKDGEWIKVGNPQNGDVGWIKNSELSDSTTSGFSFSQNIISTGKGPGTYQVFQFGNPKQRMTPEQAQEIIKKAQAHQKALQEDTQRMMQDMFKNFDASMMNFPMVMPVIIVPEQKSSDEKVSAPAEQKSPTSQPKK